VQAAQHLLAGFMLHYHHEGYDFVETMTEILCKPVELHVKYILRGSRSAAAKLHLNQFAALEGKVLAGIFAELSNHTMLFAADKHIMAALRSENPIIPQDLEDGVDVFLSIHEDKLDQWKPLLTLITNQFLKHFERRPELTAKPILFLLDEFPRLGKIENIITALTTLRSKKITISLVIQSLAQLDFLYGCDCRRVILDNCAYKAILGASDAETQEYFSRLVGTHDVIQKSISTSYLPSDTEEQGHTISEHTVEQRIIPPHEFATLNDIVLLTPWGYFRVKKISAIETYGSKKLDISRKITIWQRKNRDPAHFRVSGANHSP
jgi:type IV secretion system protein VirD4